MSWRRIRPLALGVPRRDNQVFVSRITDTETGETFYRPVGGGVEFGEYGADAIVREFNEELDMSVTVTGYAGTIENVFTFEGEDGHEIVLVFDVELPDSIPGDAALEGVDDGGRTYTASWRSIHDFDASDSPLYPEGLRRLLVDNAVNKVP